MTSTPTTHDQLSSTLLSTSLLSTRQHRALLARMASDDAFRARLAADPAAALGDLGVVVDASDLPAEVILPSKSELAAMLATGDDEIIMGPRWMGPLGEATATH